MQQKLERVTSALGQATETIETQRKDLERYESQIDAVAKQDGRVWCAPLVTKPPGFVPLARGYLRRPTIVSILNLKGGVGKTTLTANLGGYLACHREKWVLLLDLDHQRSLTQTLFTSDQRKDSAAKHRVIQAVLRIEQSKPIEEVEEQVQGNGFSRLRVVGNSDAEEGYGDTQSLDDREMDLLGDWLLNPSRCDIRYLLRKGLHHSRAIQERYNYVLIDCPPRLTTASINALAASDFVLIPAQGEPVSATSVSHLLRRLRPLRDADVLPALRVLVVGNRVSKAEDKKSKEMKLLDQTAAVAAEYWKPLPVRFVRSAIYDSGQYARYQRDFETKRQLQLPAIAIKDIQDEYACLTKELEQSEAELIAEMEHSTDERRSPSRVSP
jgi:cellulose biosynthesis protein BcsQ